ncbi:PWWP domain-containing protein [[Candida] jaroonii]|uniref:PWWP domain-containing protein n=1 Tax=[Candida] jaroonii TaxID=467808 RepID=A0ACA9Y676_9ASCO|nr:PWWP domain-containing protein [[Candida] jaroonii]
MAKDKLEFKPKSFVLAKMPGYPAWPSYVMPNNEIPKTVLREKPKNKLICVLFIPDADFVWCNPEDLKELDHETLEKKITESSKKKGKGFKLTKALVAAREMTYEKLLAKLGGTGDSFAGEEEEEFEEEVEEKIEEPEELEEPEPEPELEEEDVPEPEAKPVESERAARKRRRIIEEEEPVEHSGKNGVNGKKEEKSKSDEEKDGKESKFNGTSKRFKTVSPGPIESPHKKEKPIKVKDKPTEEEKLEQLWLCRIKLQKSLIQRNNNEATIDDLSISRLILHKLADFPMELNLLKKTKIHKVLKHILKEQKYELNESFKLHEKCRELLDKWSNMIDSIKREKEHDLSDIKDQSINNDLQTASVET